MPRNGRRLGKGLGALLSENLGAEGVSAETAIPVEAIRANPFQPRRDFDPDRLLQPVVVRPVGEAFEIVVGERRFRAIQSLGWTSVPALVREVDDEQLLVVALVENLQRHDLSSLEEARGYRRLMEDFGLTQEEVGRHVGRDRSTVANALRLLGLPDAVLALLAKGQLSAGHGRALLTLSTPGEQARVALEAVEHGWSVRETERRVRRRRPAQRRDRTTRRKGSADPFMKRAELGLERGFGTQVRIRTRSDGAGEVVVRFQDADDFLRLVALMGGDDLAADLRE